MLQRQAWNLRAQRVKFCGTMWHSVMQINWVQRNSFESAWIVSLIKRHYCILLHFFATLTRKPLDNRLWRLSSRPAVKTWTTAGSTVSQSSDFAFRLYSVTRMSYNKNSSLARTSRMSIQRHGGKEYHFWGEECSLLKENLSLGGMSQKCERQTYFVCNKWWICVDM